MTIQSKGAGAGHLESLAARMTEIDTRPNDGHLLGMKEKVDEAIEHLLRSMFPYHFGKSRARFVETEKRTYELMRAYDALVQTLELVYRDPSEATEKADELINSLPDILEILICDRHNRNIINIYLVFFYQVHQEIHRSLEHLKLQRNCHFSPVSYQ